MSDSQKDLKALILESSPSSFDELRESVSIETLFRCSAEENRPRLAFRSAWALEHLLQRDPVLLEQYCSFVQDHFVSASNWSVLRSYSKLVMVLLSQREWWREAGQNSKESLLEKSFSLVERGDCPVAVKVNCWDILFGLVQEFDWLAQELRMQIEIALEKEPSAAIKSRGARILTKLNRTYPSY
ncbi:MAG: hypothetical protein ACTHYC_00075 [Sphingobacterium sp.]